MPEVKNKWIKTEIVRRIFIYLPNIENFIVSRQLTFVGKVAHNSDNHTSTNILTAWCNQKRRRGGVLHTNKKIIVPILRLIITGVEKPDHSKHGSILPLMTDTGDT